MGHEFINDVLQPLAYLGGIALIVLASAKAKLDHRKLDMQRGQQMAQTAQPGDAVVLEELKALKRQVGEMQNTSHQFDISFDAALERLEKRVSHVETKNVVIPTASVQAEEVQHVGRR